MTQYIDKSAIIAEIERLITELVEEGEDTMFEQGRISAFEDVKVFINHTLEVKEIGFDLGSPNGDIGAKTIWDENKIVSVSEPSNNLEEAARKIGQKYFPNENNIWARPNYEAKKAECAFMEGAKWQKEHLMAKVCSFLRHYQEYPNHDIATGSLIEAFKMYIEL